MDEKAKIKVTSNAIGEVIIIAPDIPFRRSWANKGASQLIEYGILEQLMYDTAALNMLRDGILYIEDMEAKKALGLEPEEATKPTNIIILTDAERKALWETYTLDRFKDKVSSLSEAEVDNLIDYAVANPIMLSTGKCKWIKTHYGRDILRAKELADNTSEE